MTTSKADKQQIMVDKKPPPPGFEFIPIGHPRLTQLCKELSREEDAMIFIVSVRIVVAIPHTSVYVF